MERVGFLRGGGITKVFRMKTHLLVELHKIKVAASEIRSLQIGDRMSNFRREGRNKDHNSYSGHLCVTHDC